MQADGLGSLPLSRCATAPARGELLEAAGGGAWRDAGGRAWESPPQSLRDSSPSGGAVEGSGGSVGGLQADGLGSFPLSRWATAPPRGELLEAERGVLGALQADGLGSLPLSRCATAPARGELLEAAEGVLGALQADGLGSFPLSRCATAPPRGEQLQAEGGSAWRDAGGRAWESPPQSLRDSSRSGGAVEGRGGVLGALQADGLGGLPLSRCATAPPRGEQLKAAEGSAWRVAG